MKRFIKAVLVFAMLAVCLYMLPKEAKAEEITSGTCGENLTWTLDDTGTLTISGEGEMYENPWISIKDAIRSVVIEEGVTSIYYGAFYQCSNLTSVEIPDGVTSIGGTAFCECSSLTSIEIPKTVTRIGGYAFGYCNSLATIDIPKGVTSIEDWTFYNCENLTSVVIPESVTSIGEYAFYLCNNLTNIQIPKDVISIGEYAFYYCSSITSIVIPEGVTSISDHIFDGCSLTEIKLPERVMSIGEYAFAGNGITSIEFPECVMSIGEYAFAGNSFTSVEIPENITSIGAGTFAYCRSLTSIKLPENITSIGDSAFSGCESLTSIKIPVGVECIGNSAFYQCSSLITIEIPESVTSIGDLAFRECFSLTSIEIPNGVSSIGEGTFYSCNSLTTVTIPESILKIEYEAFCACFALNDVFYYGTLDKWNEIAIGENNEWLSYATLNVFCLESKEHPWGDCEIIKPPTCVEEGVGLYTCPLCGFEKEEILEKLTEHTWGDGWISAEPTCKSKGEMTYQCTICWSCKTEEYGEKLTKHSYNDVEYVDDDCHKQVCNVCGYEDLMRHNWGEGWISAEPTCKSEGEMTYQCTICWNYKTEKYGDKLTEHSSIGWENVDDNEMHKQVCYVCGDEKLVPHTWDYTWISKYPSCNEEGEESSICYACGDVRIKSIPNLTHSYSSWVLDDNDKHKRICFSCGDVETEYHNWGGGISIHPTCTTEGEMSYSCSICWDITRTEPIPKLEHSWGNHWVSVEATCKDEGEMTYQCVFCSITKTESIPKLTKHSYSWVYIDENSHRECCTVCGREEDAADHNWYKWTSKSPTCKDDGKVTYQCDICGGTKTESIPKHTRHNYSSWEKADDNAHKRTCSVCGDVETADHSWQNWISVQPSCKDEGERTYRCSVCYYEKMEPIEKLTEHFWGNSWFSVEPTCIDEGEMTYQCVICSITKTEPVGKREDWHSYGDWESVNEETHKHSCSLCGVEETRPHKWYEDFSLEPTCNDTGMMIYQCICGDSKMEELDATGAHDYVDGVCTFCGNNDPDYVPPTQPSEPPIEPSEPSTQPSEPPVEPSEPTTEPQLDELGTKLAELEAMIVNLPNIPEKEAILLSMASIRDSIELPATEENLNAVLAMFDELSASVAAAYPEGEAEIVLEKIAEIEALISELLPEDDFEENLSLIEQIIQLIMNWLSELLALFGL